MTLTAGTRLGAYEILAPIGSGGMGEVYQARDTKLGREVAIKILPEAFFENEEKLARFEREARFLASLNHPNIATLYGLESSNHVQFLVMELVPGETLAERLTRGPMPLDETLPVFKQIAEGLEAAHEKGIIHRDLKPANIKITPDGKVKVLDFGLAKAMVGESRPSDLSQSPTITREGTETGVILGTAAYMSPEQARGHAVNKQADVWAFGCVLYEALAGRKTFDGTTVTDMLATIIKNEPDWTRLPPPTPPKVRDILRRCLIKDPRRRQHDIADVRAAIEEELESPESSAEVPASVSRWNRILWAATGAALALIAAALWSAGTRDSGQASAVTRFALHLPETERVGVAEVSWQAPSLAVSPGGRRIVYTARHGGIRRLYVRDLDQPEARLIPGTENQSTHCPFFSPDGEWIAYFTSGELRKVSLATGTTMTLSETIPVSSGGAWGSDGYIYFTLLPVAGLARVSETGGEVESVTELDTTRGETGHLHPRFLPDGRNVLFTVRVGRGWDKARVAVLSLATGKWRTLIEGGTSAHYVPTGHIVYARAGQLFAAPFDRGRLEMTGPAIPVLQGVLTKLGAEFGLSRDGSLVYLPSGELYPKRTLVWVDRAGRVEPLRLPLQAYAQPRLSPDGQRLAVVIQSESGERDIWVADLARATLTKLTLSGENHETPAWSPDGTRVAYAWARGIRPPDLFWMRSDGSGEEEPLLEMDWAQIGISWSPDGETLAFGHELPETKRDIYLLALDGEGEPRPFLTSQFTESKAAFSPDGQWIAYESDESGRAEVYVSPFPRPVEKHQISRQGGSDPLWARHGGELFYRNRNQMMVVPVESRSPFRAGEPRLLFEYEHALASELILTTQVAPDGQRFLMIRRSDEELSRTRINVVLNWAEELKRMVPTN